jgi:2-haloacid dehalogenase
LVESNNIQNYFDDIMSVENVGVYKPDSKVYEMPIKKYSCKPENICFLSSNTWDVQEEEFLVTMQYGSIDLTK